MTKKYKRKKIFYGALSLLANVAPALVYVCIGFSIASEGQRVVLSALAISALIITGLNLIAKVHLRSPIWILILAIHTCIDNIQTLLIIMAICTIVDEFVFTPLYNKYKEKYIINKEIDERITE